MTSQTTAPDIADQAAPLDALLADAALGTFRRFAPDASAAKFAVALARRPPPGAGPVIVLNAIGIRCDAIILRPSGAELVPLPGLTAQDIHDQVEALLSAIEAAHDISAGRGERDAAEHRLSELLGWLWDAVTGPVLGHLAITGPAATGRGSGGARPAC